MSNLSTPTIAQAAFDDEGVCRRGASFAPATRRQLDPRASFAILLLLNVTVLAPTSTAVEAMGIAITALLACWCGRWASALRWTLAYVALVGLTMLVMAFPNPVALSFGPVIWVLRRIFVIGMFASNMIATTRIGEMACALQRIGIPRNAVVAITVALRLVPTMASELRAVVEAMRVRRVSPTPASFARSPLRTLERLLVPLVARLAIVADELGNAAVARGIDSSRRRTSIYDLRWHAADFAALGGYGALVAVIVFCNLGGAS